MSGIGLTPAEVSAVKRTWGLVEQNLKENGVAIMMLLFTDFPKYKQFFKKFKDMPVDELPKSSALRAHGTTFMHGVSAMVDNLEDKDTLVGLLHSNAERHYKRKISIKEYENTLNLLPGFLNAKLGSEMDDQAVSGWTKVLAAMKSVIGAKLDELKAQDK